MIDVNGNCSHLEAAVCIPWKDLELTCRRWIALEARGAPGAVGLFCAAVAGQSDAQIFLSMS